MKILKQKLLSSNINALANSLIDENKPSGCSFIANSSVDGGAGSIAGGRFEQAVYSSLLDKNL